MMLKLKYQIHIILNSKYYLVYKLIFLLFVFLILYNKGLVFCMTEDNTTTQVIEIKTIIESNVETKKESLNEISYVVGSLSEKIKELEQEVVKLKVENEKLENLLEESGYLRDMDGDDYPGFYDEWFRESDDDPRW